MLKFRLIFNEFQNKMSLCAQIKPVLRKMFEITDKLLKNSLYAMEKRRTFRLVCVCVCHNAYRY